MTPELVSALALVAFTAGTLLGFGSTAFRLVRLQRARIARPRLIWRDVLVFGLLSGTFVAIGLHRAAGLPFAGQLWWTLATAVPAVLAVWIYVVYELVVIGHRRDGRDER